MKTKIFAPPGGAEIQHNPRPLLRAALVVALYLLVFLLLDLITKQFSELPGVVTWYPPAGLTYALLLVFGVSFTPAVTIALFISSLFIYRMPQPPYLLFLWALIISLIYSLAAAFLRRRIRFDWRLLKLRDVIWLVVTTVLVSGLLATLSVSSSALSSDMPRGEVLRAIFDWWIGETVGVLTVTPFLLIFIMPGLKRFVEGQPARLPAGWSFPRPTLSAVGQMASLTFVLYWVFGARVLEEYHPLYLISLPLIWIALQRGLRGVSVGIMVLNFGMVFALWFFHFDLARLGELQLLTIVNCIVGLLMGAVVSERKQAEEMVRESELKFRTLFDRAIDGILIVDMETRRFFMGNTAILQMLGYTDDELLSLGVDDIYPPEHLPNVIEQFNRQARGEIHLIENVPVMRKDGSVFHSDINATVVTLSGRSSMVGVFRDITKRKKADEALKHSEQRFRDIADNAQEWVWEIDTEGKFTYASPVVEEILGYTPEEILEKHFHDLFSIEDREALKTAVLAAFATREPFHGFINRNQHKNGQTVWLSTSGLPVLDGQGNLLGYRGADVDITERKLAEQKIANALAEKETLLRELYHRTKNNMQVIISMLSLEADRSSNEQLKATFQALSNRIYSMALVHQKLYQSQDLSQIDLQDYFQELARLILENNRISSQKIALRFAIEPVQVLIDTAVPFGLVVTELISNSLKHAFPGEMSGEISLRLARTGQEIDFTCSDNGVGVEPGFDFRRQKTYGLQSIFALVERQLQGQASFESDGGLACHIRFSDALDAKRI